MRKFLILILPFMLISCVHQRVNTETTLLQDYDFEEVWEACVRAIEDIDFTIDGMDKASGFISAERGANILQEAPPRLTIMIRESRDSINVDCRVLQKDEFVDIFGFGSKIVRGFYSALHRNLQHTR